MNSYIVWRATPGAVSLDEEVLIEILNEGEIAEVQKEFLDKGYIIIQLYIAVFDNNTFMKVRKIEVEE